MASKSKRGSKGKKKRGGVPKTNLNKRYGVDPSTLGPVRIVTDATFDREVLDATGPVLVDFWAPWCGPCKAVAPVLEALAEERKGALKVVKYNTEANNDVASQLGVKSIPTLALFQGGELVEIRAGAMNKGALIRWLDGAIAA